MGTLMTALVEASDDFEVAALISSRDSLDDIAGADLVVDVTIPVVSQRVVEKSIELGINVLVGTSGWSSERLAAIRRLSVPRTVLGTDRTG